MCLKANSGVNSILMAIVSLLLNPTVLDLHTVLIAAGRQARAEHRGDGT